MGRHNAQFFLRAIEILLGLLAGGKILKPGDNTSYRAHERANPVHDIFVIAVFSIGDTCHPNESTPGVDRQPHIACQRWVAMRQSSRSVIVHRIIRDYGLATSYRRAKQSV